MSHPFRMTERGDRAAEEDDASRSCSRESRLSYSSLLENIHHDAGKYDERAHATLRLVVRIESARFLVAF